MYLSYNILYAKERIDMDSSSIRWMLMSPAAATVSAAEENGNIWWMLVLQLVLIALNAIFACAEIAVISTSDAKLERLAEDGNKKAKKLLKLKGDPARFLATIQVAITLSGFLGSAFAADNFSGRIVRFLVSLGVTVPAATLNTVAVIVITLILSFFTLVFGELVPKRIAMRKAETLGLKMVGAISVIATLFAPLVFLLTAATNGVLRLFGINPNEADNDVSEEDIQILVEAGSKTGAIDVEEKNMIHNIFEFDDLTAMDVATHRTEVSLLWLEESEDEWDEKIRSSNHGVYPICDETVDRVVGTLNARDYYKLGTKDRKTVMDNIVKTPYFVPENVKADVLFKNMKQTRNLFAVVLDEYGGMSGIVTMNDLIGALIGDIDAEAEAAVEEEDIIEIELDGKKAYRIKGSASLEEVAKLLGIADVEEMDCDTFGGFIFGKLGSVPDDGSQPEITIDNLTVRVDGIDDHQITTATVTVEETEEKQEE